MREQHDENLFSIMLPSMKLSGEVKKPIKDWEKLHCVQTMFPTAFKNSPLQTTLNFPTASQLYTLISTLFPSSAQTMSNTASKRVSMV